VDPAGILTNLESDALWAFFLLCCAKFARRPADLAFAVTVAPRETVLARSERLSARALEWTGALLIATCAVVGVVAGVVTSVVVLLVTYRVAREVLLDTWNGFEPITA
jgi:hypothetical protein